MLQDLNRTWYTNEPDFTICFEDAVLSGIPCAFLWLFAGLDVYYALHSRGRNIPWSPLNIGKIVTYGVLILIQMLLLGFHVNRQGEYVVYPVERFSPIIRILTFVN